MDHVWTSGPDQGDHKMDQGWTTVLDHVDHTKWTTPDHPREPGPGFLGGDDPAGRHGVEGCFSEFVQVPVGELDPLPAQPDTQGALVWVTGPSRGPAVVLVAKADDSLDGGPPAPGPRCCPGRKILCFHAFPHA
jgi:hypothetical protein